MEASDGDGIVLQHAMIGDVDRADGDGQFLAEAAAGRRVECGVDRQIGTVVGANVAASEAIRESRAVGDIRCKPRSRGELRGKAGVERMTLIVVHRNVIRAEAAGFVCWVAAGETADDVSALFSDLVRVCEMKLAEVRQLG